MQYPKKIILVFLFAIAGVFTSASAQSIWSGRTSPVTSDLYFVTWTGSQLVALGDAGAILTSTDGASWTSRTSGTTNKLSSATWTGNLFVVVGDVGTILTSADGVSWTSRTSGTTQHLYGVIWTNNQFVAAGGGGVILTSPDGITWTSRVSGTTNQLSSIALMGNQLVAVGGSSASGTILTSSDAITWTLRTSENTALLWDVISTGSQFITVGGNNSTKLSGTLLTSPDGLTWTSRTPGTTNLLWSASGLGTKIVVVGENGTVITSSDGASWTSVTSGTTNRLWSVVSTGSQWVAVGAGGIIRTSTPDVVPGIPTLNTPAQNATGITLTPTLSWSSVTGATTYHVQVATDSLFSSLILNDSSVATNSRATATLTMGTTYYWRVNAKNTSGTGGWSTVSKFTTTSPAPAVPVILSPASNASVSSSPTLSWIGFVNTLSFHVQVALDSSFTQILIDSVSTGTSKTVGPLPTGFTCYWRVDAVGSGGTSNWSAFSKFVVSSSSALFSRSVMKKSSLSGVSFNGESMILEDKATVDGKRIAPPIFDANKNSSRP